MSTQHDENVTLEQIRKDMVEYVVKPIVPAELLDENTKYFINPTGRFVIGGPVGVHSAVKTRQRLTEVPLTTQDTSQRILLPQVLPISARFSLHMQSVLLNLYQ